MATITFIAGGYNFPINNLNGSGIGFFGSSGFGASVSVGAYNDTAFITNSAGTIQGPQINSVKWAHPGSGTVAGTTTLALQNTPNYQGTLNIRFNHTSSVRTQNAQVRIYDRSDITQAATGVTTAVAHLIHPSTTQGAGGSGSSLWEFPAGTSYINASITSAGVTFSPGTSGLAINGGSTSDAQHDWYFSLSASPNSIGSKTLYGLYFSTEYL